MGRKTQHADLTGTSYWYNVVIDGNDFSLIYKGFIRIVCGVFCIVGSNPTFTARPKRKSPESQQVLGAFCFPGLQVSKNCRASVTRRWPAPEHLHRLFILERLISQSVLDIDTPGIGSREVIHQFFVGRRVQDGGLPITSSTVVVNPQRRLGLFEVLSFLSGQRLNLLDWRGLLDWQVAFKAQFPAPARRTLLR